MRGRGKASAGADRPTPRLERDACEFELTSSLSVPPGITLLAKTTTLSHRAPRNPFSVTKMLCCQRDVPDFVFNIYVYSSTHTSCIRSLSTCTTVAFSILLEQRTHTHKMHQQFCKHTLETCNRQAHITGNRHESATVLPPLLPQGCGNCPSVPTLEDPHTSRGLMASGKA